MAKRPKRPRDPMQLAKMIGDIATGERPNDSASVIQPATPATEARRKGGLKGGKERAKKLPAKRRTAIAKKAARARWAARNSTCARRPRDPSRQSKLPLRHAAELGQACPGCGSTEYRP